MQLVNQVMLSLRPQVASAHTVCHHMIAAECKVHPAAGSAMDLQPTCFLQAQSHHILCLGIAYCIVFPDFCIFLPCLHKSVNSTFLYKAAFPLSNSYFEIISDWQENINNNTKVPICPLPKFPKCWHFTTFVPAIHPSIHPPIHPYWFSSELYTCYFRNP